MNIYCLLLVLLCLAFSNATISEIRRGNSLYPQHYPSKARNAASSNEKEKILRNDMVMNSDGSYHYQYETSNGISAKEQGVGGISVQGASSYISPEGVEIKMSYTADENGYHPVGDHIPKTPDYILRALEYIRTHPPKENNMKYKHSGVNYNQNSYKIPKLSTYIAPPTQKSIRRKVTPTKRHQRTGNTYSNGAYYNQQQQYKHY